MSYTADLSGILGVQAQKTQAQNSTNTSAGTSLDMTDFLQLMVAMFQNQDMENSASTTDMMNQMVQMSVVQAISDISTLISDSTALTYSASLVGKEVTIGQYVGGKLTEVCGVVTGTGTLNGQQVIFIGNESYYLSSIMAIGRLPDITETPDKEEEEVVPGVTETPNNTETPGVTENPEVTETPGVTENPEVTETPDVTENSEVTETPDVTENPEVTETPEGSETIG